MIIIGGMGSLPGSLVGGAIWLLPFRHQRPGADGPRAVDATGLVLVEHKARAGAADLRHAGHPAADPRPVAWRSAWAGTCADAWPPHAFMSPPKRLLMCEGTPQCRRPERAAGGQDLSVGYAAGLALDRSA